MTETQAMSGAAGASANPVEDGDAEGTASASRTAVGRATVPADSSISSPGAGTVEAPSAGRDEAPAPDVSGSSVGARAETSGGTTFTRPPGMTPPAERPPVAPGPLKSGVSVGRTPLKSVQTAGQLGAARVTEAVRAARSNVSAAASRGPRRARLAIKRIDPWSVMKFSFAVSLVLFLVVIVATSVLYLALNAMGVFESINGSLGEIVTSSGGTQAASTFKITAGGVIGTSALIGAVNVVLFTALATLAAFIYNVCSDLVGGIEVTLAERD